MTSEEKVNIVKEILLKDFATQQDLDCCEWENHEKPYFLMEWNDRGRFVNKEDLELIMTSKMEMYGAEPISDFTIFDIENKREFLPKFDVKITNL